jgi:VPS inhibitor protein E
MPLFKNDRSIPLQNTILSTTMQDDIQQQEKYKDARDALQAMQWGRKVGSKMKIQLQKLLTKVEDLKTSGSFCIAELTKILTETQELLEETLPPSDYKKIADQIHGSPSLGMRVIGGIMLAIGAIAAAFALTAIATPIATATATMFLLTSSVCFFSGRRHGLSEVMNNIVTEAELRINKMH